MKTFIDFLYTLAIGAAVAVFVGMGIWAFYGEPRYPSYPDYPPTSYDSYGRNSLDSPSYKAQMDKYDAAVKKYNDVQKSYSKKVAAIALAASVIFFVAGLWLYKKMDVIGEGLALGGIFTTVYAAIRAGISDSKPYVFSVVTLILVMFLLLAIYRRRLSLRPRR